MFSRLTQGVSSVLQELSGEERADENSQDGLVPQPQPDTEDSLVGPGPPEEVLERLAQTEQLVVQLKELIREKDIQLAKTERQFKEEKEQAEVKFTKLKLQAKAKMAGLNKQIAELKGQESLNSSQNSESSFTMAPGVEEELQQLREKLTQAETSNKVLQHQLWEAEQRVREEGHAEQVRVLQAVVKEKDVRFQEQILKHEQELISLTQSSSEQALRASQQRIEELEESLRSRSEVLEMLQQELNNADQQKQILTTQFRHMEMELSEAQRLREEEGQKWSMQVENQLQAFKARLEASENQKERSINALNSELLKKTSELDEMRAKLTAEANEKEEEGPTKLGEKETDFERELANMRTSFETRLEKSENERDQIISDLNSELLKKGTELEEMRAKLADEEREMNEKLENFRERETSLVTELANLRLNLEARFETLKSEREQTVSALNDELLKKTTELDELREKLAAEEQEKNEGLEKFRERETSFETQLANLEARLETSESEREQTVNALNAELLKKTTELDELRDKLAAEEREKQETIQVKETELANMRARLEATLETSENEKDQTINDLNSELLKKSTELKEIRAKLATEEREKNEVLEKLREREISFETELSNMRANLEARLETSESEREQTVNALNAELLKKTTDLDELRDKLAAEEREKQETLQAKETELANMQAFLEARLETSENERDQIISALNSELRKKATELDELREKFTAEEREKNEGLEKLKEREMSFETQLANIRADLEARLETSENERERTINALNAELLKKTTELDELRDKLANEEREQQETLQERQASFETELANLQACLEAAEKQKEEMANKLETVIASHMEEVHHLQEKLDEVERERVERSNSEQAYLTQVQNELESLRVRLDTSEEEKKAGEQAKDMLEKLWRGLQSLTTATETEAEISIPTDPAQFLEILPTLEAQFGDLKAKQQESEPRMSEITLTLQSLQGQLDKSIVEREEAVARIQELEQQRLTLEVARESVGDHVTDRSVRDLDKAHPDDSGDGHSSRNAVQTDHILHLEQQLAEREKELSALREKLSLTKDQTLKIPEVKSVDIVPTGDITGVHDTSVAESENLEDTREEETTLVAVETSVLSVSADNESSPEFIGPQPESPAESKGTSSDEMVTSSDSEVAHSSWTLLEAVNQEWPPQVQDWHVTTNTCIVDIESQTLDINKTEQVCIGQQEGDLLSTDLSTSQAFAQILAEEIQKRYSELLGELQQLRDSALQSQKKVDQLEEELQSFKDSKNEAESKANIYENELLEVRAMIQQEKLEGHNVAEQLQEEIRSRDIQMQALKADLDEAQRRLVEQEGQARMLTAQLEDREFTSNELEKKLLDMENRLLQISQEADKTKAVLFDRTAELEALQKCLSQRDQEMMELNDSMTAKLLQSGEERFTILSEVKKLKEQIHELEKVRDDQQNMIEDKKAENEELVALQKEKEDLVAQLAAMKKDGEQVKRKLQAALIQRKDLMKKVAEFKKEVGNKEEKEMDDNEAKTLQIKDEIKDKDLEIQRLDVLLQETREVLNFKEETLISLQQKINNQDQALAESDAEIQRLTEQYVKVNEQQILQADEDKNRFLLQIASMESDIERLHKKLQEATDAHEDAVVKAQEKDSQHLEQMKQQTEAYSDLLKRFQNEEGEKAELLNHIRELEQQLESKNVADNVLSVNVEENVGSTSQSPENKQETNDWGQDDWVDFASAETETQQQHKTGEQSQQPLVEDHEAIINALQKEIKVEQATRAELELRLQESQSHAESKVKELLEELEALREKERQIDGLTEELEALRVKCQRAESHAETLKAEVDQAWESAKRNISDAESPIKALQSEVEEFKHFLKNKNDEIIDLSQQLSEQNSLLLKMQETVSEKDQRIASLQEVLKTEQDKSQKLEAEVPQREVEDKDNNAKLQQLQRKLQAALVSRKEALKNNQALKEEQAVAEKIRLELQQKLEFVEVELNKSKEEREKLIKEVDRTLLENQSLSASCESLKLAMDSVLNEKDACKRQVESAKEEAQKVSRQLEEKVQSMKEEYETLLKSYENVSDEAERVRRVLEAARQERQELVAKARAHETARQEAERLAEQATKEVDVVKEKMRKFAKVKQQKIMELEEENERLREQQDKKSTRDTNTELRTELKKVKEELENLKANYNIAVDEKNSLEHQAEELRQRLREEIDRNSTETLDTRSMKTIQEVKVVTQQRSPDLIEKQEYLGNSSSAETNLQMQSEECIANEPEVMEMQTKNEMNVQTEERLRELEISLKTAEGRVRELEAALEDQLELRNKQESMLNAELVSLKKQLQESLEINEIEKEESSKKDTQLQELRSSLEAERDDLEERLMNQLAQVNGSIAGYQQEAADSRDRLADMQRELEKVKREQAELEAEVASERDRAARMEEDMRQAQRERAEAEVETGKQRQLEQKLKSAQRFKEGSQNRTRQLEELLKEKQLEVRQLQKDCIEYQERISELVKDVKSMLLGKDEVNAELEAARLEISKIIQERTSIEAELSACKGKLNTALEETKQVQADKLAAEEMAKRLESELKADAERTLDEVRYRLGAELKQMELRLEKVYREQERQEEATLEARSVAEAADKRVQETQSRLDQALARLAAFSRSMSSLQDDRDRVLDEAKQWENRFHNELQEKEADVREAENRAKELAEQLQIETTQKEELQNLLERIQKTEENLQLELTEREKKHSETLSALEQEKADLQQKLTQVETNLVQTSSKLTSLEAEAEGLRHQAKALEEAVDKLQGEVNEARTAIKEREAEEMRLGLRLEQLETDLSSSKNLTKTLQESLDEKERREMELLGEKEHAVTQAVEEARKDADGRAELAEKELEKRKEELRGLEERLRKAEEDAFQSKAQLESFTKAMGSLQDDRDRVLSQYKQLEERHLQVMMEKDSLIQEAAGENNGLKEELRALLSQRDDLNAENAKLSAQLHGYRNDLNQVLAMKDSQHKQILAAQVERINVLEREKEELTIHIQALEKDVAHGKVPPVELETLSQASEGRVTVDKHDAPGAEVEKLREQLLAAKKQITTLEETLDLERETQAAHTKELKELRWEGGIMRTETETAEERVAELARDLLMMEQQLLEEREAAAQLRAQNQSFGQAMASLQDARDQAATEAKELRQHLEEINRTGHSSSSPSGPKGEVWSLKNALSALQNDRERMLEQLRLQKSELDRLGSGELSRISQALEEERRRTGEREENIMAELRNRDAQMERDKQELEMLRQERMDWQGQAELLKQQTLTTLSDKDQQVRQLTALLEEARASKLQHEYTQRQGSLAVDAAPGGPLEHNEGYKAEYIELQKRLDEETEQRLRLEEQLIAAQDHLKSCTQGEWQTASERMMSETAVLIEPPEGAVTRTRSGGPGLLRMLRVAFCSRQRTPLLVSLYLLTVHVLLLLCMGGYL
nr:golgin subfamily B member 1 [Misgurnus anguillicaudatus]